MKKYISIFLNLSWIFVFSLLQFIFVTLIHHYSDYYLVIAFFDLSITVLLMIFMIEINFYFLKKKDEQYRKEERRRIGIFYLASIPISILEYHFFGGINYLFSYFLVAGCLSLYSIAHLYALQKSNVILDIFILIFICSSIFIMPGFFLGLVIVASGFMYGGFEKKYAGYFISIIHPLLMSVCDCFLFAIELNTMLKTA